MSRADDILRIINKSIPNRISDQYFIIKRVELPTLFNKEGVIQIEGPRDKEGIIRLFKKLDNASYRISQWINQKWVDIE